MNLNQAVLNHVVLCPSFGRPTTRWAFPRFSAVLIEQGQYT